MPENGSRDADVKQLRDLFARHPGKTQKALAEAIGVEPPTISKMMNGKREIKAREMRGILEFFGQSPVSGFGESAADFVTARQDMAPVYRSVSADDGYWRIYRAETPVDTTKKLPHFEAAVNVFAVLAPDDAMAPRFKAGETLFVDPSKPISPGGDALFIEKRNRKDQRALLAEVVDIHRAEYTVLQHHQRDLRRLPTSLWTGYLVYRGF